MERKLFKKEFADAKVGGLAGIGISLILTIVLRGFTVDYLYWFGNIIFGYLAGFLITFGNEIVIVFISKLYLNYKKSLLMRLAITFILSGTIFFIFTSLFNIVFVITPPNLDIVYMSFSVGIASIMVSLFFIFAEEKEELLRLEKENRELALIDERNRIARELHDSVSQNLFGINLNLNTVLYLIGHNPVHAKEIIQLLQEMVVEVQTEMRLMIYGLRPLTLSEKGFFEAVENLIRLYRVRYNLNIISHINGDGEKISSQVQLVLYRIIQESLNNVVKHSKANKIQVDLSAEEKYIVLIIQDNGSGFNVSEIATCSTVGINSMKERVNDINGKLNIESRIGLGTKVSARIELM